MVGGIYLPCFIICCLDFTIKLIFIPPSIWLQRTLATFMPRMLGRTSASRILGYWTTFERLSKQTSRGSHYRNLHIWWPRVWSPKGPIWSPKVNGDQEYGGRGTLVAEGYWWPKIELVTETSHLVTKSWSPLSVLGDYFCWSLTVLVTECVFWWVFFGGH